jgi:hypothetical protein
MGALSSWAMLALTHHFIVQVAAWESGYPIFKSFKDYAILGDDMVLSGHQVARQYLRILKDLGVECNLSKSVLSARGKGLEFAKNTFIDKQNVSPISIVELSESLLDATTWAGFSKKFNLSWDRQMQILGYGYLSRRKSFKKMNHAMQLIYLSQIAKVDFSTDTLKLRVGAPKDLDKLYFDLFKFKVINPLLKRLFKLHQTFPSWLKSQLKDMNLNVRSEFNEFDRFDLRNAFDLVMGKEHSKFATQELIRSLVPDMSSESFSALLYFNYTDKVFEWLWPYLKVKDFNEAIQFYFKLNRQVGKLSLAQYGLYSFSPRLQSKKLPIQARLFRDWSLISHKVLSEFRKVNTPINVEGDNFILINYLPTV